MSSQHSVNKIKIFGQVVRKFIKETKEIWGDKSECKQIPLAECANVGKYRVSFLVCFPPSENGNIN